MKVPDTLLSIPQTQSSMRRTISKLKGDGLISLKKGKIAMSLEQYRLGQETLHHYVNY